MDSPPKISHVKYFPLEYVEVMERYSPGGYHPVALGDRLSQGRYTILNKLGHGAYSTVWMARDEPAQRFVAVKIHVASVNTTEEREMRQHLARAARKHSSSQYIQHLLDAFTIDGPNGSHDSLVSEPGGFSLMFCKEHPFQNVWIFPLEVARAIVAQMILATSFIHSQGIVHGDLHLGNFVLRIPFNINSLTTRQYLTSYPSSSFPVQRLDGLPLADSTVPSLAVVPRGIGKPSSEMTLADAGVMLTDFGQAWMPSKRQLFHLNTPRAFMPPETLFADLLDV